MKLNKNDKILLGISCLLIAFIISYNLFYIPKIPILVQENYIKSDLQEQEETQEINEKLININTADNQELSENLPGIGEVIAERIIHYRENNGGFYDIQEIKNVKGIGEAIFEKIKNKITV
ncbi:MAG: helix-hairpin-helix domain-containing protein [Candidatus Improbicoccus devescovinae]|nr:MAG: helix-hairpin-helix domain-containing protein [Candidatus Improbicoccus devescovinae]